MSKTKNKFSNLNIKNKFNVIKYLDFIGKRIKEGNVYEKSYPDGGYIVYDHNGEAYSYFVSGKEVDQSTYKNYIVKERYENKL